MLAENIIQKYGELKGDLHLIEFNKGSNGLGVSLAGNRNLDTMSVFVVGIKPDSPTAKDGRMRVGDELLEVRVCRLMKMNKHFLPDENRREIMPR